MERAKIEGAESSLLARVESEGLCSVALAGAAGEPNRAAVRALAARGALVLLEVFSDAAGEPSAALVRKA